MDRYHLENPGFFTPDEMTEEQRLIVETGNRHEADILAGFRTKDSGIAEIDTLAANPLDRTLAVIRSNVPIIYQAALADDRFAGFADFIILGETGTYEVWDTKLARSPKPYYAIQLCCYTEMLSATCGLPMPKKFGIILGNAERVEFPTEDFIHYYRHIRQSFMGAQDSFSGNLSDRPEPDARGDHGRWSSHAEQYFADTDHLTRVAGIASGQIKKLRKAGIVTVAQLAGAASKSIPKLAPETLEKLAGQARLQNETLADRLADENALAKYEVLSNKDALTSVGLAALPQSDAADVFFDMEGYPLMVGGLEYLWGVSWRNAASGALEFTDWWAHDRNAEKKAFEGFIDWVHARWQHDLTMHIYHYAPYEVSAVRRLSTRHDTRADEVDDLLRNHVFVDLYKSVREGLRIGEDSYSIKKVERLYRPPRSTDIVSGGESIVQYARWIESGEPGDWQMSPILSNIRDYNRDDCDSTEGLYAWLRRLADENGISPASPHVETETSPRAAPERPEVDARLEIVRQLRARKDDIAHVLGDVVDFHRREAKPMWWRMFERAGLSAEELCDDASCIHDVRAVGEPVPEKRSLAQAYCFDPEQECKLAAGDRSSVMFSQNLNAKFGLIDLDITAGTLKLKIGAATLKREFDGEFPSRGSLLPDEFVNPEPIPAALAAMGSDHLGGHASASGIAFLARTEPLVLGAPDEPIIERAIAATSAMSGGSLVIQGPPGTGKTYSAARVINNLIGAGKRVGISSNGHKAILNLLRECAKAAKMAGDPFRGIKVGGDDEDPLYEENTDFLHIKTGGHAFDAYASGVAGGTAWLFSRPEWAGQLDFLFIDEAGQVSLANTVAMSRSARNLVLLGDQMQLEQPVQGAHPGDAGLSGLQYALKDMGESKQDAPAFHSVVPVDYGLFLGESRRMHPAVCEFISESIYGGRLLSHTDCARQRIAVGAGPYTFVAKENGIVFSGVEHEANIQQSDEEVERVTGIFTEMLGRLYAATDGATRPLALEDFLFISPYNAQVRALERALPAGARVGSVDKFQGQEAPVCILSLCSSVGEYGSRGLGFILDRNRINVAISRAQCLAIVVGDPRIAGTSVTSINDMKLLNLYCKLVSSGS